jgi:hypothetical protein
LAARLLEGAFICPATDPAGYKLLKYDDQERDAIDATLRRFDLRLAVLDGAAAYFATWANPALVDSDEIHDAFKSAMAIDNPAAIMLLGLVKAACPDDDFAFAPGDTLRMNTVLAAVSSSESLSEDLKKACSKIFKTGKLDSDSSRLAHVFAHLHKLGYLHPDNASKGHWIVAGKIEHLHAVVEYIIEHSDWGSDLGDGLEPPADSPPPPATAH